MHGDRFGDLFSWKKHHYHHILDVLLDPEENEQPATLEAVLALLKSSWDLCKRALHNGNENRNNEKLSATLKLALESIREAYSCVVRNRNMPLPRADRALAYLYSAHTAITCVVTSLPTLLDGSDRVSWAETSLISVTEAITLLQRTRKSSLYKQQYCSAAWSKKVKITHRMMNAMRHVIIPISEIECDVPEAEMAMALIGAAYTTRLLGDDTPPTYKRIAALTAQVRYAMLLGKTLTADLVVADDESMLRAAITAIIIDVSTDATLQYAGGASKNKHTSSKKYGTLPLIQFGVLECAALLENAQRIWKKYRKTVLEVGCHTAEYAFLDNADSAIRAMGSRMSDALMLSNDRAKNYYRRFDIATVEDRNFAGTLAGYLKELSMSVANIVDSFVVTLVPREMFKALERVIIASERVQDRLDPCRVLYSHNWNTDSLLPAFPGETPENRAIVTTCYSSPSEALLCNCTLVDTAHLVQSYLVTPALNAIVKARDALMRHVGITEQSPGDYEFRFDIGTHLTELLVISSSYLTTRKNGLLLCQGVIKELESNCCTINAAQAR